MKVLHGMTEIAGQGIYSVMGLRANGVDAHMAVWRESPVGYQSEEVVGIGEKVFLYPWYALKMLRFALQSAQKYDCFHFHFGHSLLPYSLDLPLLKKLNKKIYFEFHGSELRGVLQTIPYKYFKTKRGTKRHQKKLLKIAKYADGIILHDKELQSHLPKTKAPVYFVPLRLELDRFSPCYPNPHEKQPLIVHAPSNRGNKGTEEIVKGIEALNLPYRFELVENKTQEEALNLYKQADIIVDQISVGTYGVLSIEGMALGKPVLTYISPKMRSTFPDSLPIVSIEPDTLTEKLTALLQDGDLREKLGQQGRKYVEDYHDYRKNGNLLKEIYEENIGKDG